MEFTLKLSEQEIQLIANILAEKPFGMVENIIGKIRNQVGEQVKENQLINEK